MKFECRQSVGLSRAELTAQRKVSAHFWAPISGLDGRCSRVITLADKVTVLDAFPDRVFDRELSYFADTDSLYIDLSDEPRPSRRYQKVSC